MKVEPPAQYNQPHGSVLGTLLFTEEEVNYLVHNVPHPMFHFYADDPVIYCATPTPSSALSHLQSAFK